jgi:hypothetical protein
VRRAAEQVLRANWREGRRRSDGVRYAFTCPATPRYRHQWYWDSCFHAIAWTHFDRRRARDELRTLVRAGRLDGFIPHTSFWDRPAYWRRAPFYGTHTVFGCSATSTIQTPLLALAWERVAQGDTGFIAEGLPQLRLHYDWLQAERDLDGDGLLTTIYPDESGLDDAPKYDGVFGWMRHDSPGHTWLIERYRRLGYDARRIAERYDEHVEDVLVNVFYALSLRAMSRLDDERGAEWAQRARHTETALLERCHDERTGLFYDLHGRAERQIRVSTWSSLAPLALPALPEDVRRRIVEQHLLDERRYHAPCGIPSVAREEPSFKPGFALWRCWRGPSWVNTAWLLVPPMRELGYEPEAERIVDSLALAAARDGLREYYNPLSGRGLAARDFGMSALLADLLANSGTITPDPSATGAMMSP